MFPLIARTLTMMSLWLTHQVFPEQHPITHEGTKLLCITISGSLTCRISHHSVIWLLAECKEWRDWHCSCHYWVHPPICERIWEKGPLCAEAEFLFLIAYNCKAVIATELKPGVTILQSLHYTRCKFRAHPLPVWAWQSRVSHAVKYLPFYASRWCPTVSGRKIATLPNVGFLQ